MQSGFPLLRGCCISCSGLNPSEKDTIHRRIEQLGGSVSSQLTNLVTHVVIKNGLSSLKYQVAAKVGIPVVTEEFLSECEIEAQKHNANSSPALVPAVLQRIVEQTWYRPFTGCIICTTGFDEDVREQIKRLSTSVVKADAYDRSNPLEQFATQSGLSDIKPLPKYIGGGASYQGGLTPACTHLIAIAPQGQKYAFAKEWNLAIVTFEWFFRAIRTGYRQNEADFALAGDNVAKIPRSIRYSLARASSAASEAAETDIRRSLATEAQQLRRSSSAILQAPNSNLAENPNIQPKANKQSSTNSLTSDKGKYCHNSEPESAASHLTRSRLRPRRLLVTSASDAELPPPLPQNPLRSRSAEGCPRQQSSLIGMSMQGCSISDDEPDPFVNNNRGRKRGSSKDFSHDNSGSKRYCKQQNSPHETASNAQAMPLLLSSSSPPQLALTAHTQETSRNGDAGDERLFEDCLFTSVGFSGDAQLVLQQAVCDNGGEYVDLESYSDKQTSGNVPSQLQRMLLRFEQQAKTRNSTDAYVVIQLSGHEAATLCTNIAARSPNIHVVTECWLEQCLYEGYRYPDFAEIEAQTQLCVGLSKCQHVLFRPLCLGTAQAVDVEGLSLSISGYEGMEREHIGKLAHVLGIAFSEKFSRKASHLICHPPFSGPKYERAIKWGTAVVESEWLYRLAASSMAKALDTVSTINTPVSAVRSNVGITAASPSSLALNTPASWKIPSPHADTPGRTPIDVSLERHLDQAISNNARMRWTEESNDTTQLSPSHALAAGHKCVASSSALSHVLKGTVIALSTRVQHRRVELVELALQLGCRALARLDPQQATHLIHQTSRERETVRDCRIAAKAGIVIVSPWWLYACRDTGRRVPEAQFPCTFHPERHLRLIPAASAAPLQEPRTAPSSNSGTMPCVAWSSELEPEQDSSPKSEEPKPSIADTNAIGSMLGKKAARTHRRYRQAQHGPASTIHTIEVDGDVDDESDFDVLQSEPSETLKKPRHSNSSASSLSKGMTEQTTWSRQSADKPLGKWWLNIGSGSQLGHQAHIYSQEAPSEQAIDSMPNTAAVAAALDTGGSAREKIQTAGTPPPHNAGVISGVHTSPLAAHKTTIVYSEDVDALSERDRLIQKLVGK
ncbi:protein kinase activating protein dpb11 [Coemansia brasiliensis]|uniref:Protein kinase activating protein dpb11 n=1 Tax=Coemansia brasiliensis TaxID=2650707 RepID=A0A9W8M098_9FUNG|nr:protein kinase activating protein dpb11 [Coemansia brasiliensis]